MQEKEAEFADGEVQLTVMVKQQVIIGIISDAKM